MTKLFASLTFFLCIVQQLEAQFTIPAKPNSQHSHEAGVLRSTFASDTLNLNPPPLNTSRAIPSPKGTEGGLRPLRFAESLNVDISPSKYGKWQTESDGSQTWLLTLRCAGARSLGLSFDDFYLPKGAKLFLHASNGLTRGAYTEQNNTKARRLDMAHLRGEVLTLELNLPSSLSPSSLSLHLGEVHYGYIDPYARAKEMLRASGKANPLGEPLYNYNGTGLSRLRCAPHIVAYPEYKAQSRATLLMVMEGKTMGTGTLINNSNNDGTAYVLTASHNLNRLFSREIDTWEKVEAICRTTVFFFGFESPSVDQDMRGTEELSLSGAELVAYHPESDMALLKISGLPRDTDGSSYIPSYYNAYYCGWNIADKPKSPYYGVHHALASSKRVCIAADDSLSIVDYSLSEADFTQKHWRVKTWATGITEAGASGSALFDRDGLIIGALTGGSSTCNSPHRDSYFAIKQTWQTDNPRTSLKPWLDPNNSGIKQLSGYDPYAASTKQISRISPYYAKSTAERLWASYTSSKGVTGIGRSIYLSGAVAPLGVYLQLGVGSVALSSSHSYIVELRPIRDKQVEPSPVWSSTIDNYNYKGYDTEKQAFVTSPRTIGEDELELFVPSSTTTQLPAGEYLLSIRPSNGTDLSLPLLMDVYRATSPAFGYRVWKRNSSGEWQLDRTSPKAVWLDLLVQGTKQDGDSESRTEGNKSPYPSYYHSETLYCYNAGSTAELHIYGLDGRLWLTQSIPSGESQTNISMLPAHYTYVVWIKGDQGSHSYKFAKK